jgi:FkbM family methyltransferase
VPGPAWSLVELFPDRFVLGILDIGAALNELPLYQRLVDAGRARIIGFEPNAAECERLNRNYGPPHRFHPYFVGDGRAATFHETNWTLTGSLFEPNSPLLEKFQNLAELMRPVARHAVATTRLDDVPDLGDVDFIKLDVQGSELAILQNGPGVLGRAVMVQTEVEFVEMYRDQPLFADVDTFLRAQGFQFHVFESIAGRAFKPIVVNNDVNARANQELWADAIYVRDWMRLDALDAAKLRNYAVLAHDLLNSFDLAHLVLSTLDRKTGSQLAPAYLQRLVTG